LPLDWREVARIYEDGMRTGNATFEVRTPAWEEWNAAHSDIRLVATLDGELAGWAALSPTSSRACYRGVAEDSVYVASWTQGHGVGRALLERLIERSED